MDFVVPKRHKHLSNVLKSVRGGKFRSWVLMPEDVEDIADGEEEVSEEGCRQRFEQ